MQFTRNIPYTIHPPKKWNIKLKEEKKYLTDKSIEFVDVKSLNANNVCTKNK